MVESGLAVLVHWFLAGTILEKWLPWFPKARCLPYSWWSLSITPVWLSYPQHRWFLWPWMCVHSSRQEAKQMHADSVESEGDVIYSTATHQSYSPLFQPPSMDKQFLLLLQRRGKTVFSQHAVVFLDGLWRGDSGCHGSSMAREVSRPLVFLITAWPAWADTFLLSDFPFYHHTFKILCLWFKWTF